MEASTTHTSSSDNILKRAKHHIGARPVRPDPADVTSAIAEVTGQSPAAAQQATGSQGEWPAAQAQLTARSVQQQRTRNYVTLALSLLLALGVFLFPRASQKKARPFPVPPLIPGTSAISTPAWLREALKLESLIAAATIAGVFCWLYGRGLLLLPIFGDAANHASLARSFLERGPWETLSPYPPLYHLIGAGALALGGETGFKLISVVSLGLLGIATFLVARQITGSTAIGLLAEVMALLAPQTLFFSARMYMEILLCVFVLLAVLFVHRYLRLRRRREIMLAAVMAGMAALTKQQGLVLVTPAIALFLGGEALLHFGRGQPERARAGLAHLAWFLAIVFILAAPATLWQFRSTGHILPDTEYTTWLNDAGQAITGYEEELPEYRERWDEYLDEFFFGNDYDDLGYTRAEKRHIWPWQVATPRGFYSIHSLYWFFPGWQYPRIVTGTVLALITFGLAVWVWRSRRDPFLWFVLLFLVVNYSSFLRNNDQVRYHLYISFMLAFALPYGVTALSQRRDDVSRWALAGLAMLAVVLSAAYLPAKVDKVQNFARTQAYAPSVGGMASVAETSYWLRDHLADDETYYAVPTTEFGYYSGRDGIFDYRIYFLPQDTLQRVFADMGVTYIVLPDSTVVPDDEWTHILWTPQSFADNLEKLYPLAFTSKAGDILVFQVRPATAMRMPP